jgi:hypothetical protein
MDSTNYMTILSNIAGNLIPVQGLITGSAYLLGLLFFYQGVMRMKKLASKGSGERPFVAYAYILGGAGLVFLPSTIDTLANTLFGSGNVLAYATYNRMTVYGAMGIIIQTAGLFWAVRGFILMVQASQPGSQHGFKGLGYLIAGILAINFDNTIAMLNSFLTQLTSWAITIKKSAGY